MRSLVVVALLGSAASADPKVCKAEGQPLIALRHLGARKTIVVYNDTPPPAITGGFVIWPTGGFRSYVTFKKAETKIPTPTRPATNATRVSTRPTSRA